MPVRPEVPPELNEELLTTALWNEPRHFPRAMRSAIFTSWLSGVLAENTTTNHTPLLPAVRLVLHVNRVFRRLTRSAAVRQQILESLVDYLVECGDGAAFLMPSFYSFLADRDINASEFLREEYNFYPQDLSAPRTRLARRLDDSPVAGAPSEPPHREPQPFPTSTRYHVLVSRASPFYQRYGMEENLDYSTNVSDFTLTNYSRINPPAAGLRYGVELELAPRRTSTRNQFRSELFEVFQEHPIFICKYDGSIPNDGSEIVTAPLLLSELQGFFSDGLARLSHARSTRACGMHVHAGLMRNAQGQSARPSATEVLRMLAFIYDPAMREFIDTLARRQANHYCQRLASPILLAEWAWLFSNGDNVRSNDHHQAVHFSRRHPTVEFRIFASSTEPSTLRTNVEFIDALIEFSATEMAISFDNFVNFVNSCSTWPALARRLATRRFTQFRGSAPVRFITYLAYLRDWENAHSFASEVLASEVLDRLLTNREPDPSPLETSEEIIARSTYDTTPFPSGLAGSFLNPNNPDHGGPTHAEYEAVVE